MLCWLPNIPPAESKKEGTGGMSSHWLSWTCTRVTCSYGFELITWSMVTASVQLGSPWLQWNASTTATSEISTIHGQCLWWDANTVTTYNSSGLSGGNEKNADNFKKSVSCGHFRAHCLRETLFMRRFSSEHIGSVLEIILAAPEGLQSSWIEPNCNHIIVS